MGFKLMTNFNRPYFSRTISEFWKRWHISLSTWFKDYLYISLGGNRVSIPRWYFNLFIVFAISGLWHGANWTYIIWGAINGFYLVFAIITETWRKRLNKLFYLHRMPNLHRWIQIVSTFILACFAWIFFRANSTEDAFLIMRKIFTEPGIPYKESITTYIYGIFGLGILMLKESHDEFFPNKYKFFESEKPIVSAFATALIIILILSIGVFDGGQFIYFQF
jgi:D-alanyl-lipoteichoic acid acyltransferase DltB (MBOAT superfamily)